MVVPSGAPISSFSAGTPPSITYLVPVRSSATLVTISTIETAAILASASPRNPKVSIKSRSLSCLILLVAWRKKAISTWSLGIPPPLSVTRRKDIPPSLISTVIALAPASIAFSTSSFAILAGLSTTSPAAILSIVAWSNTCIMAIASSA